MCVTNFVWNLHTQQQTHSYYSQCNKGRFFKKSTSTTALFRDPLHIQTDCGSPPNTWCLPASATGSEPEDVLLPRWDAEEIPPPGETEWEIHNTLPTVWSRHSTSCVTEGKLTTQQTFSTKDHTLKHYSSLLCHLLCWKHSSNAVYLHRRFDDVTWQAATPTDLIMAFPIQPAADCWSTQSGEKHICTVSYTISHIKSDVLSQLCLYLCTQTQLMGITSGWIH